MKSITVLLGESSNGGTLTIIYLLAKILVGGL